VDLKPFDAQLMLPIDKTPVSLLLDGTHVGRGSEWSARVLIIRERSVMLLGAACFISQRRDAIG